MKNLTVSVFTLGCKTNYYESQQIVALLKSNGYTVFDGLNKADVVILNTCAVTKEAEHKSRQAIARAKAKNPSCRVLVVGCASQKCAEQFTNMDNVTFVKGTANKEKILDCLQKAGAEIDELPTDYGDCTFAKQSRTRAFVKIQDGCNNFCSYCIVPYLRGRNRSRNVDSVVAEIKECKAKEIVLIGIDLSQYGRESGESTLADLLKRLSFCKARIRLGSLEPRTVTDELLTSLKSVNFCPHFHLSMQSGCTATLKRMNRKYSADEYYSAVCKIREAFPSAAVTTDVIVGFCGETEEEFRESYEFVKKCAFSDIHVFPYSRREGTAAFTLSDLPVKIKKERVAVMLKLKSELKESFMKKQLGESKEVLLEQRKNGYLVGYTPEYVKVYVSSGKSGSVVKVILKELYNDGVKGE